MRKVLTLLAALVLGAVCVWAQNARDYRSEIASDPLKAGNVFYMYNHDVPVPAAAPRGYKPVYISHYGRHGARNHSSEKDFATILKMLKAASERGLLTEKGKTCLEEYSKAYKILEGNAGAISLDGVEQQHKIAHNMYRRFPRVFKRDAKIDATATTVPRVILTMGAFCDQMHLENPRLQIAQQSSEANMGVLNPFTLYNPDVKPTDEGYNNRNAWWQDGFHKFRAAHLHPDALFGQLFTDPSIVKEFGKPLSLEVSFYETAMAMQCNSLIPADCLSKYIPFDELIALYECLNYRFYCSKGPDTLWQKGRQWAFCWTTMQDILDKADSDLATGEYAARLRFGHDIIIMSMFVLLDVDGYNKPVGDFEDISKVWESYDFPMSLNVQFVFYRGRKGDILVRVLYNERDLALPIPDCGTRYFYRWDELKAYAQQRIDLCHSIISSTQAPPKVH